METIPYDEASNLVAITVETYTARRAYEIADEYRLRGVPVILAECMLPCCLKKLPNTPTVSSLAMPKPHGWVIGDARHAANALLSATRHRPM